jgi:transcriptional regulator with XRE-family HTH domain
MIVHTLSMVEKRNPLGPTGETVRANVERLRGDQNLGYAKLASILKGIGREIPELGLRRIESGDRRVDVDDLMALAVAFGVTPATLLMPAGADRNTAVKATAVEPIPARMLWAWLSASDSLPTVNLFTFAERAWPTFVQDLFNAQVKSANAEFEDRLRAKRMSDGND